MYLYLCGTAFTPNYNLSSAWIEGGIQDPHKAKETPHKKYKNRLKGYLRFLFE